MIAAKYWLNFFLIRYMSRSRNAQYLDLIMTPTRDQKKVSNDDRPSTGKCEHISAMKKAFFLRNIYQG